MRVRVHLQEPYSHRDAYPEMSPRGDKKNPAKSKKELYQKRCVKQLRKDCLTMWPRLTVAHCVLNTTGLVIITQGRYVRIKTEPSGIVRFSVLDKRKDPHKPLT